MYLNSHSYFSLNFGVLSIKDLVAQAKLMGCRTLALTDINNTSGIFDFVQECQKQQIKPIVGVGFRNGIEMKYICLAKNEAGLFEINQFLSNYLLSSKAFPTQAPKFQDSFTIYPIEHFDTNPKLGQNEFIGVRFWEINKLFKYQKHPAIQKTLVYHSVTFHDKATYNLHRLLRAIGKNLLLSKLLKHEEAHPEETFYAIPTLLEKFQNCQLFIKNTAFLINSCLFEPDFSLNKNKQVFTNSKADDITLLTKLTFDGAAKRYESAAELEVEDLLTPMPEISLSTIMR